MCSISIIIPIYNGEDKLRQCLDSVIKQDVKSKEIICVDDGSMDASAQIVKDYQTRYSYIKLLEQDNQGAAVARNNALTIASGKYVAFMDADDFYIDETGLRKMIDACEENKVSICGSFRTNLKFDEMTPAYTYTYREVFDESKSIMKFNYEEVQYDYHYQSYIFKKELLDKNRILFPNLRRYQDPPFFAKAMWIAREFVVVPVELYCYRTRANVMEYSFVQINDTVKGIRENLLFAKENGLKILYENSRNRLNKDFCYAINHSIEEGNLEILKLLVEISEILDEDFLKENRKFIIKPIEHLQYLIQRSKLSGNWSYKFPFAHIPYGSKIVLYGAGNVGKAIYSMVDSTDYCEIVIWADRQYEKYQKDRLPVRNPEDIDQEDFDYIIVAVESSELFEEIKKQIIFEKWDNGKRIIGPVEKK